MIIVFPMLTDENVSQNALPGICKALERFVIIYELDAIMKMTGWKILQIGGKLAAAAASAAAGALRTKNESKNILEDLKDELQKGSKGTKGDQATADLKNKVAIAGDVVKAVKNAKDIATTNIGVTNDQVISLEPTYTVVTTTTGTRIIGIKVIPVSVKSEYSLAELLTVDASMNLFNTIGLKISRKVIKSFWALCRGLRIPFLKDRVITGDPEKDILWASTFHKSYVFCLLNYADITDNQFFKNAGGIHKLHNLGWNSFVAMDDVGKRAIFCMKQFHGLCSSVPYQFIYSSLGKEHGKVYEKLEDIKKASSPFFRTSVSIKKLVGESKDFITDYLKRIN